MHHVQVHVDECNIREFSDLGTGIIWNFKLAFLEGHCDMGLWETFFALAFIIHIWESSVYSSAKLTEEKQELFGSSIELERDSAELDWR